MKSKLNQVWIYNPGLLRV